jgi:hypothetical protein
MKKDMKEQHEELVALLETQPDLSMSDSSSVCSNILVPIFSADVH